MTRVCDNASDLVDDLVSRVGREIVLGLPVGIGKAVHVANALYERALADSSLQLTIFTALTLEVPRPRGDLEARFLGPLVERLFAGWPALAYVEALRRRELPPNVDVREFYFRPAAFLGNPLAQRAYTSINYSQVADELLALGVNVIAQIVSARPESPGRLSLGSNPEVTLDLLPHLAARRREGTAVAIVGQVNRQMPYMTGEAELPESAFDYLLDDDACEFPLFGLPSRAVAPADYATGMHVASLIPDGGTIQLGIGSLSDAVAHCLRLRHESPELFGRVLSRLPGGVGPRRLSRETGPFREGLYAASELLSDALYSLFERGVLRRHADADDETVIHGGFFVGSSRLYRALRELPEADRSRIAMTRISFVNTLLGDEDRKRLQRRGARFVNETMMATLLGAAVSDALEDGRVVSGVGGQFDFVAMAHALHDGASILMLRARRADRGRVRSNIRWTYGHTTVPRHHRDVFVTEYGVAETRGRTDQEVIEAMLAIADSAFQPELLAEAKSSGKLEDRYRIPDLHRGNTPGAVRAVFEDPDIRPCFPTFPLGSELTREERRLAGALEWLQMETGTSLSKLRLIGNALLGPRPDAGELECLARMGLERPGSLRQYLTRRLLTRALKETNND